MHGHSYTAFRARTQAGLRSRLSTFILCGIGGATCLFAMGPSTAATRRVGASILPQARTLVSRISNGIGRVSQKLPGGIPLGGAISALAVGAPMRAAAFGWGKPVELLEKQSCLQGRDAPIPNAPAKDSKHFLLGNPMYPPFPENLEMVTLGMGCFWCSENLFMRMPGVYSTHVGYAQGETKNPTYEEVCSGRTNHNEVVRVVYDPKVLRLEDILKVFWERHDPTTPNQQGNDRGTQYRSGIYVYNDKQREVAEKSKEVYQNVLIERGFGRITTEIAPADEFYYAEDFHQQYDAKPGSRQYCGLSPLGTQFPTEAL